MSFYGVVLAGEVSELENIFYKFKRKRIVRFLKFIKSERK